MKKNTTVLLITYKNNEKEISKKINKLYKYYKIIIVENSDNIILKKKIKKKFSKINFILSNSNLGFSKQANIGLKKIKTKNAVLITPDLEINHLCIKKLESYAARLSNFSILAPNSNFLNLFLKSKHDYINHNLNFKEFKKKNILDVDKAPGYCLFLKMKDVKKINYFDENIFFYFEDLDLCKRIKDLNKKIYIIKNAYAHHNNTRVSSNLIMREWNYYWSMFYYHQKHYGYYVSLKLFLGKLFRFYLFKFFFNFFNKNKYLIYSSRFDGLFNQILKKKQTIKIFI